MVIGVCASLGTVRTWHLQLAWEVFGFIDVNFDTSHRLSSMYCMAFQEGHPCNKCYHHFWVPSLVHVQLLWRARCKADAESHLSFLRRAYICVSLALFCFFSLSLSLCLPPSVSVFLFVSLSLSIFLSSSLSPSLFPFFFSLLCLVLGNYAGQCNFFPHDLHVRASRYHHLIRCCHDWVRYAARVIWNPNLGWGRSAQSHRFPVCRSPVRISRYFFPRCFGHGFWPGKKEKGCKYHRKIFTGILWTRCCPKTPCFSNFVSSIIQTVTVRDPTNNMFQYISHKNVERKPPRKFSGKGHIFWYIRLNKKQVIICDPLQLLFWRSPMDIVDK